MAWTKSCVSLFERKADRTSPDDGYIVECDVVLTREDEDMKMHNLCDDTYPVGMFDQGDITWCNSISGQEVLLNRFLEPVVTAKFVASKSTTATTDVRFRAGQICAVSPSKNVVMSVGNDNNIVLSFRVPVVIEGQRISLSDMYHFTDALRHIPGKDYAIKISQPEFSGDSRYVAIHTQAAIVDSTTDEMEDDYTSHISIVDTTTASMVLSEAQLPEQIEVFGFVGNGSLACVTMDGKVKLLNFIEAAEYMASEHENIFNNDEPIGSSVCLASLETQEPATYQQQQQQQLETQPMEDAMEGLSIGGRAHCHRRNTVGLFGSNLVLPFPDRLRHRVVQRIIQPLCEDWTFVLLCPDTASSQCAEEDDPESNLDTCMYETVVCFYRGKYSLHRDVVIMSETSEQKDGPTMTGDCMFAYVVPGGSRIVCMMFQSDGYSEVNQLLDVPFALREDERLKKPVQYEQITALTLVCNISYILAGTKSGLLCVFNIPHGDLLFRCHPTSANDSIHSITVGEEYASRLACTFFVANRKGFLARISLRKSNDTNQRDAKRPKADRYKLREVDETQ